MACYKVGLPYPWQLGSEQPVVISGYPTGISPSLSDFLGIGSTAVETSGAIWAVGRWGKGLGKVALKGVGEVYGVVRLAVDIENMIIYDTGYSLMEGSGSMPPIQAPEAEKYKH